MQFVRGIADRVFFIAENSIYEEGKPEEILRAPQKERTQQFLLRMVGSERRSKHVEKNDTDAFGGYLHAGADYDGSGGRGRPCQPSA
jgi:ABC-type methionine transport system ATPase subunit